VRQVTGGVVLFQDRRARRSRSAARRTCGSTLACGGIRTPTRITALLDGVGVAGRPRIPVRQLQRRDERHASMIARALLGRAAAAILGRANVGARPAVACRAGTPSPRAVPQNDDSPCSSDPLPGGGATRAYATASRSSIGASESSQRMSRPRWSVDSAPLSSTSGWPEIQRG